MKSKRDQLQTAFSEKAIILFAGVSDIVPLELKSKFNEIAIVNFGEHYYLRIDDLEFIWSLILRYPFSYYFILKNTYKIALYRAIIDVHKPKAIICSSEYSFTSSLLTAYCNKEGIKHVNVMHGDKLFYIREAFFQFHQCYVWDNHYIDLFKTLRADKNQFIIAIPPSLRIEINPREVFIFDFTYYLGGETKEELNCIREALERLPVAPIRISVRPHPRYSDLKLVSSIFTSFQIESTESTSISQSFSSTKSIVSLYSTVLYQGYMIGKEIIIDDVSNEAKFNMLLDLQYIMLSKPYKKLSTLIIN